MSQYMSFFIRIDDNFYRIDNFSRNHTIYEELDKYCPVPYEKVRMVTKEMIQNAIVGIKEDKEDNFRMIQKAKEEIQLIASMNNSVDEKLNSLRYSRETIKECEESISDYDYAIDFCVFLFHIIENLCDEEDESAKRGLYFGIEIGKPTIEDIV